MEVGGELVENEGKGAADDEEIGAVREENVSNTRGEAGGNVLYNFFVQGGSGDMVDMMDGFDDASGGKMFPLERLTLPGILNMAGLKSGGSGGEETVFGNAATDASAEGEIDGFTFERGGFGECGEIGVIFGENGTGEVGREEMGGAEIVPLKIGGGDGGIGLDDTRDGDDDFLRIGREILEGREEGGGEGGGVLGGGQFVGFLNFARSTEGGNESFGAADVNR